MVTVIVHVSVHVSAAYSSRSRIGARPSLPSIAISCDYFGETALRRREPIFLMHSSHTHITGHGYWWGKWGGGQPGAHALLGNEERETRLERRTGETGTKRDDGRGWSQSGRRRDGRTRVLTMSRWRADEAKDKKGRDEDGKPRRFGAANVQRTPTKFLLPRIGSVFDRQREKSEAISATLKPQKWGMWRFRGGGTKRTSGATGIQNAAALPSEPCRQKEEDFSLKNGTVEPDYVIVKKRLKRLLSLRHIKTWKKNFISADNMPRLYIDFCEAVALKMRTRVFLRCMFLVQLTRILFQKNFCALKFPRCIIHARQDDIYLKKLYMKRIPAFSPSIYVLWCI